MHVLDNDAIALTRAEFDQLPEYSTTLPTGQTPGKAWKARVPPWASKARAQWHRGVYGKPYPEGHEHHGQIPIGWRAIVLIGRPPAFPQGVRLPAAPMRGRHRDPISGHEEGDLCARQHGDGSICLGVLEMRRADLGGCTCFRTAPCASCLSEVPECPRCGHREPEPC